MVRGQAQLLRRGLERGVRVGGLLGPGQGPGGRAAGPAVVAGEVDEVVIPEGSAIVGLAFARDEALAAQGLVPGGGGCAAATFTEDCDNDGELDRELVLERSDEDGAVVYAMKWPDPFPRVLGFHEVFHLLVVAAAVTQFVAVSMVVM